MPDVLVDHDIRIVKTTDPSGETQALLSWSLHREIEDHMVRVEATGGEAAPMAFDLRAELLTDPISYELTRGMTIVIHDYHTVSGAGGSAAARLRQSTTADVLDEILDWAYRPPSGTD